MTNIKLPLLIALIVVFTSAPVCAQKVFFPQAWDGVVVSADETTREITLNNLRGDKKQTFTGVLEPGYKQKLKDGTFRELSMSEFKPGLRIRVFYKEKTEQVAGKKVKVARIHKIEFLGRDQFTMIREVLRVPPATPVARAIIDQLPPGNPLKVFAWFQEPPHDRRFRKWVERWNKNEGKEFGLIELVDQAANADVSVVFFWGFDESPYAFMALMFDPYGDGNITNIATAQFVTLDNEGLKFIWLQGVLEKTNAPGKEGVIEKEFEKRMKARK